MKTLHLTLKKKWFYLILSGIKKEEYREKKDYWIGRLCDFDNCIKTNSYNYFKNFDTITFKNGYAADAPEMVVEFKGIEIKEGNPEWGAEPGTKYFVISMGEILSTKNLK